MPSHVKCIYERENILQKLKKIEKISCESYLQTPPGENDKKMSSKLREDYPRFIYLKRNQLWKNLINAYCPTFQAKHYRMPNI